MNASLRARALWLGAAALLSAALLHCGDEPDARPTRSDRPPADAARIDTAIGYAIGYLAAPRHLIERAAFYFVYFLHRRFEIPEFSAIPDLYQVFRAHVPPASTGVELFERVIDPHARLDPERIAKVPHPVDRFTIAALYCDQVPVPADYETLLREMAAKGGYELTHVALALGWLEENRCDPQLAALRDEVVEAMAAGVRSDERVDDLELESAALLYYLGRGDRVPRDFPLSILPAQHGDGGWAERWPQTGGPGSHWHPTVFALWVLLESQGRGNGAAMIPRALVDDAPR